MPFDFNDKIVHITGAASGIGYAIAQKFAAAGATVVATDIDDVGLERLQKDLGLCCTIRRMDAGSDADIRQATAWIGDRFGRLDVLINNAGMAILEPLAGVEDASFDRQVAVLLKGPMLLTKYSAPLLEKSADGAVVNIASIAAIIQAQGHAVYSACKAGLVKATKDSAKEFPRIRSNVILPGFIDTPILKVYGDGAALESLKKEVAAGVPRGRLGRAEEIADATMFLCSPYASYITGAELMVDGGITSTTLERM